MKDYMVMRIVVRRVNGDLSADIEIKPKTKQETCGLLNVLTCALTDITEKLNGKSQCGS